MVSTFHEGTYDIFIEHSGRKYGYFLAQDENGRPVYNATLEDALAPQRVTEGYGYPSEPAHVNVPLALQDWSGGAGLIQADPGEQRVLSYSYSQGADLSWAGRIYLSPRRVAVTNTSAEVKKILFTSLGVFAITANAVWEFNTSTDVWDSVLTSVTPTDIVEYGANVYVAMGDSATYQYSSDGTSWTASTLGENFTYFATRASDSGQVLWGVTEGGSLAPSSNPVNGGSWSAATQIGDTWETVTNLVVAESFLYIFKEEGIWSFDGTTIEDVWPARDLAQTDNGKHALLWGDGQIYVNYGDRLFRFDPASRAMEQKFPVEGRFGHPELNGDITAIGGDVDHVYFGLKNAAGNTYIMKGDPRFDEWHTWTYPGANDCTALSVQRAGAIHASNPVLAFSYGQELAHYILPGPGLRPEDDASYEYENAGTVFWPWVDAGAALYSKFLTAGRVVAERTVNQGSGLIREAKLKYSIDGSPTETELTISQVPGITVGVPADAVRFTWLRARMDLTSSTGTDTPVVKGVVFDVTPNPPRRRKWEFIVDLGNLQASSRQGVSEYGSDEWERHLFASSSQRILFYDTRSRRFVTKLGQPGVVQVALAPEDKGLHELFQVTLFEMGAQGYLSEWYGAGSKYLLPDMPGGAVGLNNDTEPPSEGDTQSATFRPQVITDHGHWIVSGPTTHSFIRFPDVTIPQGATITKAYVRLRLFATVAGDVDVDFYCEDADNAVSPTTAAEAEALSLTTATARWQQSVSAADNWWTWFQTADISAALQEVVDRAGWEPGNAMMVVGEHRDANAVWTRWFSTQEFSTSNQETFPELYVEWET